MDTVIPKRVNNIISHEYSIFVTFTKITTINWFLVSQVSGQKIMKNSQNDLIFSNYGLIGHTLSVLRESCDMHHIILVECKQWYCPDRKGAC